jgi:hypothetical protein
VSDKTCLDITVYNFFYRIESRLSCYRVHNLIDGKKFIVITKIQLFFF